MSEENIKDEKQAEHNIPLNAKEEAAEFFKTASMAVLLALVIRTFLFEPFNIPSGSMKPTLLIGDYLFVSKAAYGYSKHSFPFSFAPIEGRIMEKTPKPGDVIVFKLPSNPRIDYIKRVVALPGDTVQVKNGHLHLNGNPVPRESVGLSRDTTDYGTEVTMNEYIQTLPDGTMFTIFEETDNAPLDDTPLYRVPENHVFVMGDNRDNSQDSRVPMMPGSHGVGFVPIENIVGRADFLFFSVNGEAGLFEPWKWPWGIRYDRMFMNIDPIRPKTGSQE